MRLKKTVKNILLIIGMYPIYQKVQIIIILKCITQST